MATTMTPEEVRAFLSEGTRTGKLGTLMGDGSPHVMPIWFVLDGDDLVFNTHADSVKGRHITTDGRVSLLVDDERAPYAFVHIRGNAVGSENPPENLEWATRIGARYMGAQRAEEFGRRNAVAGELLVRLTPERTISMAGVAELISEPAGPSPGARSRRRPPRPRGPRSGRSRAGSLRRSAA